MMKILLILLLGFLIVELGGVVALENFVECKPKDVENLFWKNAYGRILKVLKSNEDEIEDNSASILCKISGRGRWLEMEWILAGEPPRSLMLESGAEISSLSNSTVTCMASDIPPINRLPRSDLERLHEDGEGDVTYECDKTDGLTIKFSRLRKLNYNMRNFAATSRGVKNSICLSGGKIPAAEVSDRLGQSCKGGHRFMYNEEGKFVCAQCCANYYYQPAEGHKRCEPCSQCSTNKHPNVWTSCKDMLECTKIPTTIHSTISATTSTVPISITTTPNLSESTHLSATTTALTKQMLTTSQESSPSKAVTAQQSNAHNSNLKPSWAWALLLFFVVVCIIVVANLMLRRRMNDQSL